VRTVVGSAQDRQRADNATGKIDEVGRHSSHQLFRPEDTRRILVERRRRLSNRWILHRDGADRLPQEITTAKWLERQVKHPARDRITINLAEDDLIALSVVSQRKGVTSAS
jgi:hypothetical protein